jgi:hypothetical protein
MHIPAEQQEKLGPHSCKTIFMGYPPGVKAWCCHDSVTGAFFNSCDIIFDESFSNCPFPLTDDDNDDDKGLSPHLIIPNPAPAPIINMPPAVASPITPARCSGRIHALTE